MMNQKKLEEVLTDRFYTYLCMDMISQDKFENPFKSNNRYWIRLKKDAENMAKLVTRELK